MHTTTLKEINELKAIVAAKEDRIGALKRIIENIRARYSAASAVWKEVEEVEVEISKEQKVVNAMKAKIRAFYAPAVIAA